MVEIHRNLQGFMTILTSAACEWFLIFMLLIDAACLGFLADFGTEKNVFCPSQSMVDSRSLPLVDAFRDSKNVNLYQVSYFIWSKL